MYKIISATMILTFILVHFSIHAQESNSPTKKSKYYGINASVGILFPASPEFDFIRGDILPYSSGGVSESLNALVFTNHFGISTEFRNKTYRWGFLFGLNYSRIDASLGKSNLNGSNSKYFYLLDNQTGTTTEYFRVKEIDRSIDFIGLPIEIRWLANSPQSIKLYLKLGVELNFKINSGSSVAFYNQDMSAYQDIVLNKFEQEKPFFSAIYFATGLNLDKKPNIDLELIFPYVVLTPKTVGILEPHAGIGLKLGISLPY